MRPAQGTTRRTWHGFTLIEVITVLILLGIVSVIGVQFVTSATDAYQRSGNRTKLIAGGRRALERLARQIHVAVPNSVRITNSGSCVEFIPIVAGGGYIGDVPDPSNGAAAVSSVETGGYTLANGTARYLFIGVQSASEAFSSAGYAALSAAETHGDAVVELAAGAIFIRNSEGSRFYLGDDPEAFCVSGSSLYHYSGYATPATASGVPGGSPVLLAEQVSSNATPFTLSQGTEDRNTVLSVRLAFARGGETVVLNRDVMVRNVY